ATNGLGEVVPLGAAAIGVTDWLELEGQYEVYSALGEGRAALLNSEQHGIALAVGGGAGGASGHADDLAGSTGGLGGVVIGRRFSRVDIYVADRFIYLVDGYTINAIRGGGRVAFGPIFVGAEGGATLHQGVLWLGEGTLILGVNL